MTRPAAHSCKQKDFNTLLNTALRSPDAVEVVECVKAISLSSSSDANKQEAILQILATHPSTNNVVATCLAHLTACSDEAVRKGIKLVFKEPDGFDTDCSKISAIVRLVSLSAYSPEDTINIAHYAGHPRVELRNATLRGIKALSTSQQQALLLEASSLKQNGDKDLAQLALFIRAINPATEATPSNTRRSPGQ